MSKVIAKGIDVSEHQGKIDWNRVKASGIDFAIIRTGYGDTLSNPGQVDKFFHENMDGAIHAGLDVGVYHFSYAKDAAAAKKEARCVLELIKGYKLNYPVCFDYEYDSDRLAGKPGIQKLTDMAKAFLSEVEQAHHYAMIYSNRNFCQNRFDMDALSRYDLWLADYNEGEPWRSCGMRQTGSTGKVDGITGNVDMDVAYQDYPARIAGNHPAPDAPSASPSPAPGSSTYTVRAGDTLWGIAARYLGNGSRYTEIKILNCLSSDTIHPGQKLQIPAGFSGGSNTAPSVIHTGSSVRVRKGAKTYDGGPLAAFVYGEVYNIIEVKGDRAVIGKGKAVTAAVKLCDLNLI